jgi:hypothetical protein
VLAEVALADPCKLEAVTTHLIVLLTSDEVSKYVLFVAPEMLEVPRCHWYVNVGVGAPVQVPVELERVAPITASPVITGTDVLLGAMPCTAAVLFDSAETVSAAPGQSLFTLYSATWSSVQTPGAPPLLFAETTQDITAPASAFCNVYVLPVAPEIFTPLRLH